MPKEKSILIDETEQALILDSSAANLLSYIRDLADFGPRIPGSNADEKSIEYIVAKFKEYGMDIQIVETGLQVYEERESTFKVLEPGQRSIKCRSMVRSGLTPKSGIQGDLTFAGYGLEEDYKGKNVKGKIAIVELGKIHCIDKVSIAAGEGALGIIIFNKHPGNRIVTYGLSRFGEKIPVLSITNEDGHYLLNLLKKGSVRVIITVDAHSRRGKTKNIIGVLKGSKLPEEIVVLDAHRDTVLGSPGANDNASGTAVLLEIARILSKRRCKRTIAFISSAADEGGSIGSHDIIEKRPEFVKKFVAFMNIDMVGAGSRLWIVKEGRILFDKIVRTTSWLNSFIRNIAVKNLNYAIEYGASDLGMGDEYVYLEAGVPAAWIWKPDDDYYHSEDDTPEKIDPNSLKAVLIIAGIAAWRLATAEKVPP